MAAKPTDKPTQKTQPRPQKNGKLPEPLDIPIPKKRDVFGDLVKVAQPAKAQKARKDRRRLTGKARPSNKKR